MKAALLSMFLFAQTEQELFPKQPPKDDAVYPILDEFPPASLEITVGNAKKSDEGWVKLDDVVVVRTAAGYGKGYLRKSARMVPNETPTDKIFVRCPADGIYEIDLRAHYTWEPQAEAPAGLVPVSKIHFKFRAKNK